MELNKFDAEILNFALVEQIDIRERTPYIERLKILFPEMNDVEINLLHEIIKNAYNVAESIVSKYYYKEKQSKEEIMLLLKDNFEWINNANLVRLFNVILYYLK